MKYIPLLLLLILQPLNLMASGEGSSSRKTESSIVEKKSYEILHVGVPLIAAGLVIKPSAEEFQQLRNSYCGVSAHTSVDDYTQYAPAALMLGLKASGVESRSSWGRMLVSDAFSVGIATLAVNGLKSVTNVGRPDTGAKNSFPSGHTTTAFMTATMLHKEYGDKSIWYSIAGYSAATATGLMRVVNNRHWISDVLVGAGLGIISTELGYLIADVAFKDRGLNREQTKGESPNWNNISNTSSIGLYIGVVQPIGEISDESAQEPISIEKGSKVGVEGSYFFNQNIGIGGALSVANSSINIGREVQDEELNIISAKVGCYFAYNLIPRLRVGSKATVGMDYYEECSYSNLLYIREGARAALGTSLWVEYLANRHYSLKAFCDYDASFQPYLPNANVYHSMVWGVTSSIIF